jgi:hypothetical protein
MKDHGLRRRQSDEGIPKPANPFAQKKLRDEERQYGKAESRRRRDELLRNDPILGPFLQRVEAHERRKASEMLEQMAGKS